MHCRYGDHRCAEQHQAQQWIVPPEHFFHLMSGAREIWDGCLSLAHGTAKISRSMSSDRYRASCRHHLYRSQSLRQQCNPTRHAARRPRSQRHLRALPDTGPDRRDARGPQVHCVAAGQLQKAGIIRSLHGRITIVDRVGLENAACDCFEVVAGEHRRLLVKWPEHGCSDKSTSDNTMSGAVHIRSSGCVTPVSSHRSRYSRLCQLPAWRCCWSGRRLCPLAA